MASGGDQVLEDAIDQFQSMQDALKNLKKKGRILGQLHALMKDEKCMEKKDFFNHESEDDYYDEEDAWMYEGPSKPAGLFEKEQVTSDDDDTGVAQETDRKSAKRDRDGKQKAISSGTRSRRQSEEASKKAKKGPEDRSGDLKKVVKSETFHLNWSRGWLKTFALANWNCGGSLKATDYDLTKMKLEVAPSTHAKLSDAAQGKEDAATDGLNTEVRLLSLIQS